MNMITRLTGELKNKLVSEPTVAKLQTRYRNLSGREQSIVKLVAGLLVALLIVQVTVVPLYQKNQQLSADLDKQLVLYNRMAENGYRFKSSTNVMSSNRPLLREVTRVTKLRQVTLSRYEQDSTNLRVWFDNASFDDAANLMQDLSQVGILVNQINIDRQDQPGRVNIRATLSR